MGRFEREAARKGLVARDIKNAIIVNFIALAWVATLGGFSYLSDYKWYTDSWLVLFGFAIHTGIGISMVLAYKRFIIQADELERKIQLDALAISVGVIIITFSSYSLLEKFMDIPELSAAYLIALMALVYSVGIIIGRRRYR